MPNDAGSGTPYQSTVNGSGQSHPAGGDCETVVGVCLEVAANHAEVVGVVSYITAQTPVLMNLIADSACLTPTLAAGAPAVTGGRSANASGATNANAPFTGTSHTVLTTGFCRCVGGCFTAQRPPASTPPEVLILMTNQIAASSPNTVNLSRKFSGKDYKLVAICQRSHSPSSASASGTGVRYTAILHYNRKGWLRYDNGSVTDVCKTEKDAEEKVRAAAKDAWLHFYVRSPTRGRPFKVKDRGSIDQPPDQARRAGTGTTPRSAATTPESSVRLRVAGKLQELVQFFLSLKHQSSDLSAPVSSFDPAAVAAPVNLSTAALRVNMDEILRIFQAAASRGQEPHRNLGQTLPVGTTLLSPIIRPPAGIQVAESTGAARQAQVRAPGEAAGWPLVREDEDVPTPRSVLSHVNRPPASEGLRPLNSNAKSNPLGHRKRQREAEESGAIQRCRRVCVQLTPLQPQRFERSNPIVESLLE